MQSAIFMPKSRLPLEYLLLDKILWRFRDRRQEDGWTLVSKSSITRRFFYNRKKETLTSQEFYHRVLPGWIRRGLAREVPRPGKQPLYLFRPMTIDEINLRGRQLEQEVQRIMVLREQAKTDDERSDVTAWLYYVGGEIRSVMCARKMAFAEKLDTAQPQPPPPKLEKNAHV